MESIPWECHNLSSRLACCEARHMCRPLGMAHNGSTRVCASTRSCAHARLKGNTNLLRLCRRHANPETLAWVSSSTACFQLPPP
eukprot:15485397-Alexandrium_andersonii.AAC.1